ncbi:MAG: 4-hydroxy-3-methylbut-2-enyl diphosphate reductase, partial [Rhodanobacteraceae bacterium]
FGVRDAIAQAEKLAAAAPLTILGELVHNPIVRERLRRRGAREGSLDMASADASTAALMITAHGASDAARRQWQQTGLQVADGTCPLVRYAHAQLRALVAAGYAPVVIGQAGHVEVRGLTEDFPGASVIGSRGDIALLPVVARYGVVSQTTQPIDHVRELVAQLRHARPQAEVRFIDTVCKPTKNRQSALQRLIAQVQLVVVVGGRASNNTRQLVATCRAAGRRVLHIERAAELVAKDFSEIETVGVTAGTSTLRETVDAVVERLRQISPDLFQATKTSKTL